MVMWSITPLVIVSAHTTMSNFLPFKRLGKRRKNLARSLQKHRVGESVVYRGSRATVTEVFKSGKDFRYAVRLSNGETWVTSDKFLSKP